MRQRLEFLGDAVLDYLITCHLFATFPDIDPGDLTDLRSATASNECFSRVAVRHHLEKFLLHENANLAEQVRKFVLFIQNVSCGKEHFYGWECDKGPKVSLPILPTRASGYVGRSNLSFPESRDRLRCL